VFAFGPQSQDEVRQTTIGVAYNGAWAGRGELRLGLQKADYQKAVRAPGRPEVVSTDDPWLYDAALAATITSRLSAYAGYTVGLEESPVAPANAVNRNEAPPALRTSQRDAGIRWKAPLDMTLVAGVFEVKKPYFNLDPAQVYRELGEVQHRGVELSLAGSPAKGLTVVAGAVLLDGEVSGELVELGRIGSRPVGLSDRQVRLNADYQWTPGRLRRPRAAQHRRPRRQRRASGGARRSAVHRARPDHAGPGRPLALRLPRRAGGAPAAGPERRRQSRLGRRGQRRLPDEPAEARVPLCDGRLLTGPHSGGGGW
jgi:outer membrane receptor protein involved in Fe transport